MSQPASELVNGSPEPARRAEYAEYAARPARPARAAPPAPSHEWRLDRLELAVHLGCEVEERASRQLVEVSVRVRGSSAPAACASDRLSDTLALDAVAERLRGIAEAGSFALIEHLAQRLHDGLRALCPPGTALDLQVTKLAPPIPRLRGGMTFRIRQPCAG